MRLERNLDVVDSCACVRACLYACASASERLCVCASVGGWEGVAIGMRVDHQSKCGKCHGLKDKGWITGEKLVDIWNERMGRC